MAFRLCELGATNFQLARAFGVSRSTLDSWLTHRPKFREQVSAGRDTANNAVADSLFHRAQGYWYPDFVPAEVEGRTIITQVWRHVPADVSAAMFWLENRLPEAWKRTKRMPSLAEAPSASPVPAPAEPSPMETPQAPASETLPGYIPERIDTATDDADESEPVRQDRTDRAEDEPEPSAIEPQTAQEPMESPPAVQPPADDFRALLGLPPRED